jgi:hypothetical protein
MKRIDFGKLIASLRQEQEDEDVTPWSQDRVALEANLAIGAELFGKDVISKIERGKRGTGSLPSPPTTCIRCSGQTIT